MFSFTWLFRIWSKNHSNFNRLWISPSFFFYCKKRFAIDFRQIAFRYPKRNIRDCLIRELLKNEIDTAEHQHHCSPSSLQTDKFSGLCFFQIWCPNDVWRLLQWTWFILPVSGFGRDHRLFWDLYKTTYLHTRNAEINPVLKIFDLFQ